jgi:hypothetical protein
MVAAFKDEAAHQADIIAMSAMDLFDVISQ